METMTLPDIVLRGPYLQSIDHVHDELTRIELLVRAQVVRWQMSSACAGPERDWGMVLVSRDEVDHYLKSSIEAPGTLPAAVWKCVKPWWDQADQLRAQIDKHCKDHPSHDLRLDALTALFNLSSSEKDILLLCLLAESGERFRRLFAYLQNDASRQTLNLDPASPDPLLSRSVRIDDRIASYLLDSDAPDSRLFGILQPSRHSVVEPIYVREDARELLEQLPESLRSEERRVG